MRTAADLKKGDTFRKQGLLFTVEIIENDVYKNGTPCLIIGCKTNNGNEVDSFFNFKLTTKV